MNVKRIFGFDTNVSRLALMIAQSAYGAFTNSGREQERQGVVPDLAKVRVKLVGEAASRPGKPVDEAHPFKGEKDLNALKAKVPNRAESGPDGHDPRESLPVAVWEEDGAQHIGLMAGSGAEEPRKALLYRRQTQQGLTEVWEAPSGFREHRVDGVTERFDFDGRIIPSGEALIEQLPGHVIKTRSRGILYMPDLEKNGAPPARTGWYGPLPAALPKPLVHVPQGQSGASTETAPQRESFYRPLPDVWRSHAPSELRESFYRSLSETAAEPQAGAGQVTAPKGPSGTDHLFAVQPVVRRSVRGDDGEGQREREWIPERTGVVAGCESEAYEHARAAGIKCLDETGGEVALIRVIADPRGQLEQFVMPDGIREWHLNGKLIYADDWGRGAGEDYYDEARARGLSVDLEP